MDRLRRLSLVTLIVSSFSVYWASLRQQRETLELQHFRPLPDCRLPSLAVVMAARNEERAITRTLTSLLDQEYPDLKVVMVDDRSQDSTRALALAVKAEHPNGKRLTILPNDHLPEDWLGKVHALHVGTLTTTSDLVLLTDADVVFAPGALSQSISAQQILCCDHLAAAPKIETRGLWEPILVGYFFLLFSLRFRPADVHCNPRRFVGVGAFNLLTREMLLRSEYLKCLRMQVIDDIQLGRWVKQVGGTQNCLLTGDQISVRWFEGVAGAVRGLEKNSYAGADYRPGLAFLGALGVLAPIWALLLGWLSHGVLGLLCTWLVLALWGLTVPKPFALPSWVGIGFPFASVILAATLIRSAFLCEKRKGIRWRDSFYSLTQLRRHHWTFLSLRPPNPNKPEG